jgi:hypothetical protein
MQPTHPELTPDEAAGFEQAEALEAVVVDDQGRPHDEEVQDLVHLADFLVPELHRAVTTDATEVITEWADGDPDLLTEAEIVAREEHREESAALLREAAEHARAA